MVKPVDPAGVLWRTWPLAHISTDSWVVGYFRDWKKCVIAFPKAFPFSFPFVPLIPVWGWWDRLSFRDHSLAAFVPWATMSTESAYDLGVQIEHNPVTVYKLHSPPYSWLACHGCVINNY